MSNHNSFGLNEAEVHSLIEKELKPYREAINPASAPYLAVEHALWFVGLLVTIQTTIIGWLWAKVNANNKSANDRMTHNNTRIHQRVDETNSDLEQTEDKLRSEVNRKFEITDKKLWYLATKKE
jgi:hypothetical protein